MKYFRFALIIAFIAFATLNAGCLKSIWMYDFTAVGADIDDWYNSQPEYEIEPGVGITMNHGYLATPVWFDGDLTVTIEIELDVNETSNARFEFWLADGIFWNYDEDAWWDFYCLGDTEEERWYYGEWSGSENAGYEESYYMEIPGIEHEDINIIKIYKVGDNYRVTWNGEPVGSFSANYFDGEEMFLHIWTGQPQLGNITIRKVQVEYTGEISDPWPIV